MVKSGCFLKGRGSLAAPLQTPQKLSTAKLAETIRRDRRAIAKALIFSASSAAFLSELCGQRLFLGGCATPGSRASQFLKIV